MRLLSHGFTTAATTFASGQSGHSDAFGDSTVSSHVSTFSAQSFRVEKVVWSGATSAGVTTEGMKFRYGQSSLVVDSTIQLGVCPSSVPQTHVVDGLGLPVVGWFELVAPTTAAGGWTAQVFGV